MKILHISNVLNNSGWSAQAENHLLALNSAGVDVSARHINLLNNEREVHPIVKDLLNKDCRRPDIIIFNTLPSLYEKTGKAKCVSYFMCETNHFRNTNWSSRLNLMDLILCPCWHNKQAIIDSNVTTKVEIIPLCIDLSKYSKDYPEHSIRKTHSDKFIFLSVGEWTTRKNLDAIIKAFHLEFSPAEPVELVIKTTPVGMSNPQVDITNRINSIKQGLKIYSNVERYKRENIICGFISETDMGSLYKSCDAYISASRAEAFNIPLIDSIGFGLVPITSDHTGQEYINDKNAYVVKNFEQSCFGANDQMPDLYTGAEHWNEISIPHLQLAMRQAFEHKSSNLKKIQIGRETIKKFSYEIVGKKYKEILEKI